jgi:amidophosphoribosyltransferase
VKGLFGIASRDDIVQPLFRGIFAQQNRGQVYCGISTVPETGKNIKIRTHRGLVAPTFEDDLQRMEGNLGIGHISSRDRQPILKMGKAGPFTIGFEGHVLNADQLRSQLFSRGHSFSSLEDVELIAGIVAAEDSIATGIEKALGLAVGACNLVILTQDGVFCARGMDGLRPMVIGTSDSTWAVASESCAFKDIGLTLARDVEPGEILCLTPAGIETVGKIPAHLRICVFEWLYFAREDSVIEGVPVVEARYKFGGFLAEEEDVDADIVGSVPFTGDLHAQGFSLTSGLQSVSLFVPPRFVLRTYNLPLDARLSQKARKFVVIDEAVRGKRILLVDDSIRAGITKAGLIEKLRRSGVKEVHVRIGSPASTRYCPKDPPPRKQEEFIAATHSVEEIRQIVGADTLRYQRLERLPEAVGLPGETLCTDCFR